MSLDWIVVPDHGRGLSGTREYDYNWAKSTKDVLRNFVGAPNVSTTSADGELAHGGFNWNVRSMSIQNMDTRQVKLSHDRGIKNDHFYVMSVPKLIVDQAIDVQAHWDLIVPVSISGGNFCFNCGKQGCYVNKCPDPLNQARIHEHKKKWETARSKDGNYPQKSWDKGPKPKNDKNENSWKKLNSLGVIKKKGKWILKRNITHSN